MIGVFHIEGKTSSRDKREIVVLKEEIEFGFREERQRNERSIMRDMLENESANVHIGF